MITYQEGMEWLRKTFKGLNEVSTFYRKGNLILNPFPSKWRCARLQGGSGMLAPLQRRPQLVCQAQRTVIAKMRPLRSTPRHWSVVPQLCARSTSLLTRRRCAEVHSSANEYWRCPTVLRNQFYILPPHDYAQRFGCIGHTTTDDATSPYSTTQSDGTILELWHAHAKRSTLGIDDQFLTCRSLS